MLEDALVGAMTEIGQVRHQIDVVPHLALAGITLGDAMDQSVDTLALAGKSEERRLLQQCFDAQIRSLADQFQLKAEGLADGFGTCKGQHLEVMNNAGDIECKGGRIGGGEHPLFLVLWLFWRAHYCRLGKRKT